MMLVAHLQSKQPHFDPKLKGQSKTVAISRPVTRNVSVSLDSARRILRVPFSVIILEICPHHIIFATQHPSRERLEIIKPFPGPAHISKELRIDVDIGPGEIPDSIRIKRQEMIHTFRPMGDGSFHVVEINEDFCYVSEGSNAVWFIVQDTLVLNGSLAIMSKFSVKSCSLESDIVVSRLDVDDTAVAIDNVIQSTRTVVAGTIQKKARNLHPHGRIFGSSVGTVPKRLQGSNAISPCQPNFR